MPNLLPPLVIHYLKGETRFDCLSGSGLGKPCDN